MLQVVIVVVKSRAGVVRRVDIHALDARTIKRQQSLESVEVVAVNNHVAGIHIAATQSRVAFEQTILDVGGGTDGVLFARPV